MARTHGQGNPKWSREETILALDLYFDFQGNIPSSKDPKIQELSKILRQLPYHDAAKRLDSFRNPDGVVFKLLNIHYVATEKGLNTFSKMDTLIWGEFGANPSHTKEVANLIRSGIHFASRVGASSDLDDDFEFFEGRLLTQNHYYRERNPNLRRRVIKSRINSNRLYCELCKHTPSHPCPDLQEAEFEIHHVVPISRSGERVTSVRDIALLCANCHRIIHRLIANEKHWFTIPEAIVALKCSGAKTVFSNKLA